MDLDLGWKLADRRKRSFDATYLLSQPVGLVAEYWNIPPFNDEPKLFHMRARLAAHAVGKALRKGVNDNVGATSLDRERSICKLVGEAAERRSLLVNQFLPNKFATYRQLRSSRAVDPRCIPFGVAPPKRDVANDRVEWTLGINLLTQAPLWIPSQLVFVPHLFRKGEVIWRAPITTGAAAGTSIEDALYAGICEVVERDAFMV